ncbi:MAG: succinate dehydrogenase assembly factor 2 [Thiolinea sp.]
MSELSRFKLRCRRGMKELDFVLDRYLQRHFPHADAQEIALFSELLDLQDPALFGMLFETEATPERFAALAEKIRQI